MFWRRLLSGTDSEHSAIPQLHTKEEFERLSGQEVGVLFKHSPSCFVSITVSRRVFEFVESRPEIPIFMVSVVRQREFSRWIAARTGIRHESPQVIVFRHGRAVAHMSHGQITTERLEQLTGDSGSEPPPGPISA